MEEEYLKGVALRLIQHIGDQEVLSNEAVADITGLTIEMVDEVRERYNHYLKERIDFNE